MRKIDIANNMLKDWASKKHAEIPLYNLHINTNTSIHYIKTGEYIVRSRWRLINIWRKFTNTEVKGETGVWQWSIPYNNKDNEYNT